MNPMILRRVKAMRTTNPWLSLQTAVMIARSEVEPDVGEYAFLSEFGEDASVKGTVGQFTVAVTTDLDDSFQLGEDDVTGTFTDKREAGCIANTNRDRNDFKWYRPSDYTRTELLGDLRQRRGMSRSVARQEYARIVAAEMDDDRTRYALGVTVTVSLDGQKLASGSLWGIDQIESADGRPYLIDVARELIDEVVEEARANLPKAIKKAEEHVTTLRAALQN